VSLRSPFYVLLFLLAGLCLPVTAQSETLLVLSVPATAVQTGQFYEVTIGIENVPSLWLADLEILYDPAYVYIEGMKAGRPVQLGSLFAPLEQTTIIRNTVDKDHIVYTASLLNPANPITGTGTLGTFRIYPLQAGVTRLTFSQAQLTTLTFTEQNGQRVPGTPEIVAFTPILLELQIAGSPVSIPDEMTATPLPTLTSVPEETTGVSPASTATPLVNITRAPGSTPATDPNQATSTMDVRPLLMGFGLLLIIVSGGLLLMLFRRRS
jgi:hypothetical protein